MYHTTVPASIPAEVVFNPNWWFRSYGISFEQPFYFDKDARIRNDLVMRRALHERFGLGETDPQPRPVIGSMHVAGGFVVPALFGADIRFAENQAPWQMPMNLAREQILRLRPPDMRATWPMNLLIDDMDALEKEFGYLAGDFDLDGILNTALVLRGQQLFLDLLEDPELVDHLFAIVAETQAQVGRYVLSRTRTTSISVNRSILNVDPAIYLNCNCSVQMISPALFQKTLLPHELRLAARLTPYGIHHCGNNLHAFGAAYSKLPLAFLDVGWGSDVARCRKAFPEAFLNLRLSPVRMLRESAADIRADTEQLLEAAGPGKTGVCCINMDYGTPDENVLAMIETAARFAGGGEATPA